MRRLLLTTVAAVAVTTASSAVLAQTVAWPSTLPMIGALQVDQRSICLKAQVPQRCNFDFAQVGLALADVELQVISGKAYEMAGDVENVLRVINSIRRDMKKIEADYNKLIEKYANKS